MTAPVVLLEARSQGSAGDWADITGWLRLDSALTITRGRENEAGSAPTSICTMVLDNVDGRFTEGQSSIIGPVTLAWTRWAQVRVSVNGQMRFTGWLTGLGQSWPGAVESSAIVTVAASGVRAVMGASPSMSPWIAELIEDMAPVMWCPMDEPSGAIEARIAIPPGLPYGVTPNVQINGAPDPEVLERVATFGNPSPAWMEGGAMLTLRPEFPATGVSAAAKPYVWWGSDVPGTVTIVFVHQPDFSADTLGRVPILGCTEHIYFDTPGVLLDRDGANLWLRSYSGETWGDLAAVRVGSIEDGVPRLWAIALDGVAGTARVLGQTATVPYDGLPLEIQLYRENSQWPLSSSGARLPNLVASGSYSNICMLDRLMSDAEFAQLRTQVEGGMGSDLSWLERACSYTGTAPPVKLGPTRMIRRPQLRGSNAAAIGEQLAAAYGGMFADGRDGTPTLVDPRYVPAQATVPEIDLDQVDGAALRWSSDPTLRVTEASQSEDVLASRSSWPRSGVDIDPGVPRAAAQSRARWLVNASDVAEAPRLTGIKLDLLAMADPSAYEPLAYLQRPRVRVVGALPSQLPAALRPMTVEGTTETVSVSEWSLELSTAPDPRLIVADSVQGVLGVPADNRLGF